MLNKHVSNAPRVSKHGQKENEQDEAPNVEQNEPKPRNPCGDLGRHLQETKEARAVHSVRVGCVNSPFHPQEPRREFLRYRYHSVVPNAAKHSDTTMTLMPLHRECYEKSASCCIAEPTR